MKNPLVNPLPFRPKTLLEERLCKLVEETSGEVVLNVWTPENYECSDASDHPIALEADFEVRTGQLHHGLFVAGSIYLAYVEGNDLRLEFKGAWR